MTAFTAMSALRARSASRPALLSRRRNRSMASPLLVHHSGPATVAVWSDMRRSLHAGVKAARASGEVPGIRPGAPLGGDSVAAMGRMKKNKPRRERPGDGIPRTLLDPAQAALHQWAIESADVLEQLGIPIRDGRSATIRQLVLQAPAPVVARKLGYHDDTTTRLAADVVGSVFRCPTASP